MKNTYSHYRTMAAALVLAFGMVLALGALSPKPAAAANQNPIVMVDEIQTIAGPAPFQWNGHVYVALRRITPAIGAKLTYDAKKGLAKVQYQNQLVSYVLTKPTATVNGTKITLATPPVMINNIYYLCIDDYQPTLGVPVTVTGPVPSVVNPRWFVPKSLR